MKYSKNMFLYMLVFMLLSYGCNEDAASSAYAPSENLENVTNESVIATMKSIVKDSLAEDVIENPETKMKAEQLKAERVDKLTQKVNASPFKGFSDDEIKEKLENDLIIYQESCDPALVDLIFEQMAYDAVLSFFKQRQTDYCRAYFKNIQSAKKQCMK